MKCKIIKMTYNTKQYNKIRKYADDLADNSRFLPKYIIDSKVDEYIEENPFKSYKTEYRDDIPYEILGRLESIDGYEIEHVKIEKDEIIIECKKEVWE